jgi:hypothetical protein
MTSDATSITENATLLTNGRLYKHTNEILEQTFVTITSSTSLVFLFDRLIFGVRYCIHR